MKKLILLLLMSIIASLFLATTAHAGPSYQTSAWYAGTSKLDPIVRDPERAHTHDFFAVTPASNSTTYSDLLGMPTKADVPQNHSSLWLPRVRWGLKELVPIRTGIYYQTNLRGSYPERTRDIPRRYRLKTNDVRYHCNKQDHTGATRNPPKYCPDRTLGMVFKFQPCWDGVHKATGGYDLGWYTAKNKIIGLYAIMER